MSETEATTVVDDTPDLGIEVWYENVQTGGMFGFGLPLPKQILPQIKNGNLKRVAGPAGTPTNSAVAVLEADEDGAADSGEDPAMFPCEECGETAAKDADGFYTDHCAKHTPKPTSSRTKKA